MMEMYPWQKKFVDAIASGKKVLIIVPRHPGKSAEMAEIMIELAIRAGGHAMSDNVTQTRQKGPTNISGELMSLCDRLGINYGNLRRIDIVPGCVVAELFVEGEHGKQVHHDHDSPEYGLPKVEFKRFAVKT